jgi:signal transduction histidine kinase
MADPVQMEQVIWNLVTNALDSMGETGTLTVTTRPLRDTAEIAVSDTGTGFGPEEAENIWKVYYTTKPTGTGIGLALCKLMVESNGGEIAATSRRGKGSEFTVRLPRA